MSITFTDAVPVKVTGTGRKAEDNPYTEVIAAIALKTQTVDGETVPVAKGMILTHTEADRDKVIAKAKRQLSEAGRANAVKCSVSTNAVPKKVGAKGKETDSKTETVFTFWTVKPILRPRKPKTDEATTPAK